MIIEGIDEITGLPYAQALKEWEDAQPKELNLGNVPLITGTKGELDVTDPTVFLNPNSYL